MENSATKEQSPETALEAALAGPRRRLRLQVWLLVAAAAMAVWATAQPWYGLSLPPTVVALPSGQQMTVAATSTVSGFGLAALPTTAQTIGPTATLPSMGSLPAVAGIPIPVLLAVGCAALGVWGARVEQLLPVVLSPVAALFAWKELTALQSWVQTPQGGAPSGLVTQQDGLSMFVIALLAITVLTITTTIQVAIVAHRHKVALRAAEADAPPTLLGMVRGFALQSILKGVKAVAEAEAKKE